MYVINVISDWCDVLINLRCGTKVASFFIRNSLIQVFWSQWYWRHQQDDSVVVTAGQGQIVKYVMSRQATLVQ